jgi:hypothetical protein
MRKDLRFRLRSFEFRRCGKVDKKNRRSLKICSGALCAGHSNSSLTELSPDCPSSAQNPKPASPGRERYRLSTTVIRASASVFSGPPDSKGAVGAPRGHQNSGAHYEHPNPASNPDHLCNALLQQLPKLMWKGSHAVYACRPTIRAARAEEPGRHWPFAVFCRSPVCSTASL